MGATHPLAMTVNAARAAQADALASDHL